MSEEILIPRMRRIDKSKRKINVPWLNLAIVIFCTLILIASTFIIFDIKHWLIPINIFMNTKLNIDDFIYDFALIPQIPAVLFICAFLGRKLAITSTILYIVIGLFLFPIFALGGGIGYLTEYGFGYIIAYIPAVILAGYVLGKKFSLINILKASILGVLIIHIFGGFYLYI